MNRWRTSPQTAMIAKPQQSSSHHSLAIHRRALQRIADRVRSVSSLGEKSNLGSFRPLGSQLGHRADHDRLSAQRGPMPQRELLGDLPLHQGIAADENQRGKPHGRQGGRGERGAKLAEIASTVNTQARPSAAGARMASGRAR